MDPKFSLLATAILAAGVVAWAFAEQDKGNHDKAKGLLGLLAVLLLLVILQVVWK